MTASSPDMAPAVRPADAADYINGQWEPIPGSTLTSHNPARPTEVIWSGSPRIDHVPRAVLAARNAFTRWSALTLVERVNYLRRFQEIATKRRREMGELITDEVGKTIAEGLTEAGALASKVDITLDPTGALGRITDFEVSVSPTRRGVNHFKPHGVMAVIGPFNFPAHLPNGHIIPALAAGNTIIFKPSEKAAAIGQLMTAFWDEAGLPAGVFNLVQGGGDVASRLVSDPDIRGILFTGSWKVGRKILEANLDRPGRMIALEMGGNNAMLVMNDAHLRQAVLECVRAGFATTGQRCTCARRIIVHEAIAQRFMRAFVSAARSITLGPGRSEPAVFMGPLINAAAVDAVLNFQEHLKSRGARILLESRRPTDTAYDPSCFITPGMAQVEAGAFRAGDSDHDCEVFGPFVQVSTCRTLEEGIAQVNATQYGLAASIFTASEENARTFRHLVNCGCINHNTGTAGASSKLAFGGLGHSGNHRPAGAFSVDYCAYPVASMVETGAHADVPEGVTFDDAWLG